jgi:hypothetical protein
MAIHGIEFMQEMVQVSQQLDRIPTNRLDRLVQLVSVPILGREHFVASPAQFGPDLSGGAVSIFRIFLYRVTLNMNV